MQRRGYILAPTQQMKRTADYGTAHGASKRDDAKQSGLWVKNALQALKNLSCSSREFVPVVLQV